MSHISTQSQLERRIRQNRINRARLKKLKSRNEALGRRTGTTTQKAFQSATAKFQGVAGAGRMMKDLIGKFLRGVTFRQ